MKVRNTFIIFLVSGFWHGANWTFIVWGFLNALFIMPSIINNTHRDHLDIVARGKLIPSFKELISVILTFSLTVFAWIFFRANNVTHAFHIIAEICSPSLITIPYFPGIGLAKPVVLITILFFIVEWFGREQQYAIAHLGLKWDRPFRWAIYYAIIIAVFYFTGKQQQFIYFQF